MKKVYTIIVVLIFSKICYTQNIQGSSDTAAIRKVLDTFMQAIIKKDSATFASTLANTPSAWVYVSVKGAETVAYLRKKDPSTPFITISNFKNFIARFTNTKDQFEEKFYNVRIKTDDSIASLSFDYSLWINNQKSNWGVENWELVFDGTDWKIAGVTFSSNVDAAKKEPAKN